MGGGGGAAETVAREELVVDGVLAGVAVVFAVMVGVTLGVNVEQGVEVGLTDCVGDTDTDVHVVAVWEGEIVAPALGVDHSTGVGVPLADPGAGVGVRDGDTLALLETEGLEEGDLAAVEVAAALRVAPSTREGVIEAEELSVAP